MGTTDDAGGIVIVWFLLGVVGAVVAAWLVHRIWLLKTAPPALKLVLSFITASVVLGGLGTLVGLVMAFRAVGGESVDPSEKARILAEGISIAMNCTAFGLAVGVASIAALLMVRASKRRE